MTLLRSRASGTLRLLGQNTNSKVLCTAAAPASASPNFRSLVAVDENTLRPYVQPNAYVSPSSLVFGSVTVNDKTCVHSGCTLRGDLGLIEVGALCILDESVTIRTTATNDSGPSTQDTVAAGLPLPVDTRVGDYTHIGSGTVLEGGIHLEGDNLVGSGVVIEKNCEIGRGAVILDKAVVRENSLVGTLEIWGGNPAEKVAMRKDVEMAEHNKTMQSAAETAARYAYEFLPVGLSYLEKEKLAKSA